MKIVVFTGSLNHAVRKAIITLDDTLPSLQWLIVLHSPKKTAGQLLRNQWRNFRRNGWRWIPYQAADAKELFLRKKQQLEAMGRPGVQWTLATLKDHSNIHILPVDNIHSQTARDAVSSFTPDLGLALAAPILRPDLFTLPRLGTINLHKGKLPEYRGMPPAFWELWNNETTVGCSVHWINERLDQGDVVHDAMLPRAVYSTVRGLQLQLDELGVRLVRETVRDIISGQAMSRPQSGKGHTYRKPTLAQVATLDRRLLERQTPKEAVLKAVAKRLYSTMGLALWRMRLAKFATPRVTVLLFHRVTDDVRDNLTVGIEQFDRQMALVQRHCHVLGINEVLKTELVPQSDKPMVAVTFDDGYLDNYQNAVPILMRHHIPAAFFVTTGIIDRQGRFPHDIRRGNPPIPLMQWEHLRQMHDWGFVIGSHSVSHIDCAAEPVTVVQAELSESRDRLRDELDLGELLFAYPYGKRDNMTPERLELVKQAGYKGCLAAYGGSNVRRIDRYNVLRRGIHWEFSDSAFLCECLGWRSAVYSPTMDMDTSSDTA